MEWKYAGYSYKGLCTSLYNKNDRYIAGLGKNLGEDLFTYCPCLCPSKMHTSNNLVGSVDDGAPGNNTSTK